MNKSFIAHVCGICFSLAFVLTQFQNCAPVSPESQYAGGAAGEVKVIEDWNGDKLSFVVRSLSIDPMASQINLDGFCARKADGIEVSWHLLDNLQADQDINNGIAECERGGFRLSLTELEQLDCDTEYTVVAGYDGVQEAQMTFNIACDSTKSAQVE